VIRRWSGSVSMIFSSRSSGVPGTSGLLLQLFDDLGIAGGGAAHVVGRRPEGFRNGDLFFLNTARGQNLVAAGADGQAAGQQGGSAGRADRAAA
jgi:hypothetical protein